MRLQRVDRLGGEADARHAVLARDALEEILGEQRDVLAALTQRRDADFHHVEAVVEVLTETTGSHFLDEVLVGGGDDAHVGGERLVGAHAGKRAILQHAQQFHLDGQRHIADFIEEKRASIRLLEAAGAACDGPGERTLLMAEEFAFEQVFGDGAAIDGDHLALAARAVFVHGLGDELLAGAALAGDEDRRIRARHPAHQFENLLQGAGNPDHFHPTIVLGELRIRLVGTAAFLARLQCALHHRPQFEGQRLLAQDIMRPALGGLDDLAGSRETGSEHHQRLRALAHHAVEQLHPIERLQLHGGHHHAHFGFLHHLEGVGGIVATQDAEVLRRQMLGGPLQEIQIGIDQQQRIFSGAFGHRARPQSIRALAENTQKNRRGFPWLPSAMA